jgi:predicted nucleotidyltransferase
MKPGIDMDREALAAFCRTWRITELCLFGSVLRDDFGPDSDVDVLVSFEENAGWTLLDFAEMERQLEQLLSRKVDLVDRRGIERSRNPFRKREILATAEPVYERP